MPATAAIRRADTFAADLPLSASLEAVDLPHQGGSLTLEAAAAPKADRGAGRFRFPLVNAETIRSRPKPEFQIDGYVQAGGFAAIAGPPGCAKTFLALGWAYATATATLWEGRAVLPGHVVYIAAEGTADMGARCSAQQIRSSGGRADRLHFVEQPVNLIEAAQVAAFLHDVESQLREAPRLVVVDTLARCMEGGDENSACDMGKVVESIARIQRKTGAAVLVLHHTGKNGESERGSTALRGAVDTMLLMAREKAFVTLKCAKQKAFSPFDPLRLELVPVAESAVLLSAKSAWHQPGAQPTQTDQSVLEPLAGAATAEGLTSKQWKKESAIPDRSFYRARKRLLEKGLVRESGNGRGAKYTITDVGQARLTATLPTTANATARQ